MICSNQGPLWDLAHMPVTYHLISGPPVIPFPPFFLGYFICWEKPRNLPSRSPTVCVWGCISVVVVKKFFCPCVSCQWVVGLGDWIRFGYEMCTHTCIGVCSGAGTAGHSPGHCVFCAQQVDEACGLFQWRPIELMAVNNHFRDPWLHLGFAEVVTLVILSSSSLISWNIPLERNLPHLLFSYPKGTDSFELLFTLAMSIERLSWWLLICGFFPSVIPVLFVYVSIHSMCTGLCYWHTAWIWE